MPVINSMGRGSREVVGSGASRTESVGMMQQEHGAVLTAEEPPAEAVATNDERMPRKNYEVPAASLHSRAELVPVPASVFDDEFFTAPADELRAKEFGQWAEPAANAAPVQQEQPRLEQRRQGYPAVAPEQVSEPDELDIPAFLRRSR